MRKLLAVLSAVSIPLALCVSPIHASPTEDIIKIKRDVLVAKGMSVKDLIVFRGSATVYGTVEGDAVMVGGSLYLKDEAHIKGQVFVIGGIVETGPMTRIDGKVTQIRLPRYLPSAAAILLGGWLVVWAAFGAMVLLGLLGLAALFVALVPRHIAAAADFVEGSFAGAFLRGILWTVLIAPITVLLAISVIGIVLIPLQMFVVALAFLAGYIASAIYVGRRFLSSLNKESGPFLDAIVGILALYAVGFVPVIGLLVKAVFLIAGFGAVVTTRFGTLKK